MTTTPLQRNVRGDHGSYTAVGDSISKGGAGAISRTTGPRWVYKQSPPPAKAPPAEHLERLVEFGRDVLIQQALKSGATPESAINWPVDIVRLPNRQIIG